MRRSFTLFSAALVMMVSATSIEAQSRKTWDFTKGLSEETKANLTADAANWGVNRQDSLGNPTGWKDLKKMSGTLKANETPIAELEGLSFGTAGLSSNSNYLLDPSSIRMSRGNMVVNLPKLAAGQTITIECKSANSTNPRGIAPNNSNVIRTAGPEDGLAPGSEGWQTHVFVVREDATDSVEVSFKVLVGGVDFHLIQIDNGDAPAVIEDAKIGYLFASSEAELDPEADPIYAYSGIADKASTPVNVLGDFSEKSLRDSLDSFDMLVYTESLGNVDADMKSFLYEEINRMPILNFTPNLYQAWGVGNAIDTKESAFTIADAALEHALFTDVPVSDGALTIYEDDGAIDDTKCMGYTLTDGSDFANDDILGWAGSENNAIQLRGSKNSYLLIPVNAANMVIDGEPIIGEGFTSLVSNAITYLSGTKAKVVAASKPGIVCEYGNNITTVTLKSSAPQAKIYYTLDGSEPTTASTRYTEPITITSEGVTVKAFVKAPGYDDSQVASEEIIVKSKLAAPSYNVTVTDGVAHVTFTAGEGDIYYNIIGCNDPALSSKFDEEAGLNITRPTIVTCFAYTDTKLPSDAVDFVVDIPGTYYNDTIMWESFKDFGSGDLIKAYDFYAKRDTVYDAENPDSIVSITRTPTDSLTVIDINDNWQIGSWGQRINNQTTGTNTKVGVESSYGPCTALDAGAGEKCALSFLVTAKGDNPASAYVASKVQYPGPFMASVWMCGQASASYNEAIDVLVSTDGNEWSSIGQISTNCFKQMHRGDVVYEGSEPVYIKIASCNEDSPSKQKTMLFDVALFGPSNDRPSTGIVTPFESGKTVKAVKMFNMAGQQIRVAESGINIITTTYSDGSVVAKKIFVK